MKYRVCTKSLTETIVLAEFDTEEEAARFAMTPCVIAYADEMEFADEDEIAYPAEMWIEESTEEYVPFSEPLTEEELEMLPY